MNKAQMAALFLAGAAAGAGGVKLAAPSPDAPPQIRVHALDLRRGQDLPDGGYLVSRVAYGTLVRADGGTKDIGQAKKCVPGDQSAQRAALSAAAAECAWGD